MMVGDRSRGVGALIPRRFALSLVLVPLLLAACGANAERDTAADNQPTEVEYMDANEADDGVIQGREGDMGAPTNNEARADDRKAR
jgi:hypothetical protein